MKYDITFHPSWWHKYAGVDFTEQFFEDPEYRMECDVKMRQTLYDHFGAYGIGEDKPQKRPLLGTDLLAAGYLLSAFAGCDIVYQADNSPQVICKELDEDSIEDYEVPDPTAHPLWKNMEEQIAYLQEHYGHVETYINLMGIQNLAMDLMGQELMVCYYTAPEEVERVLGQLTDMTITFGKRMKELSDDVSGGVTAIVRQTVPDCYLTSNCSVEMISQELYEEFLLPCDQKLADAFGSFGVHHCGQTMEHVVEGYAKLKGLTFAEVGAGSDVAAVRKALPDIWLNLRYSPARLSEASEEEIRAEVKALYEAGKAPAGCSISCVGIDGNVAPEQVIRFLQACRDVAD